MNFIMQKEALEIPEILSNQLSTNHKILNELAKIYESKNPYHFLTLGRGSSRHACLFFQYYCSLKLQKISSSFAQSLFTQYQTQPDLSKSFTMGISQSGMSPDIVLPFRSFKGKTQLSFALINNPDSDLAKAVDLAIPLLAGKEQSVAATKSFMASIFSLATIIAHFSKDSQMLELLKKIPGVIPTVADVNWNKIIEILKNSDRCLVISRGTGFPFAQEMALKLKETCLIQAEAFSAAEVKHGPWAIVGNKFPVILLATDQQNTNELLKLRQELQAKGALTILVAPSNLPEVDVFYTPCSISALNGLMAIASFYLFVADLAHARGLNPDLPRNLQKVTKTI